MLMETAGPRERAGTRERILAAALDVFAEKGFEQGTIREICGRARANVAAVNYYFQGKENLYATLLETWRTEGEERFPLDHGPRHAHPPGERLRAFYATTLKRLFLGGKDSDEAYKLARITVREIAAALGSGPKGEASTLSELGQSLRPVVAEMLGPVPIVTVLACVDSCLAQVAAYLLETARGVETFLAMRDADRIELTAAHMAAFALAGVKGIAQGAEDTKT